MRIHLHHRDYLVHVPTSVPASPSAVIVLHGAGATAEWMRDETGWHTLADREGFVAVFPEGVATFPDRRPKFLTNPQRWNDGSPPAREWANAPDDVAFLAAVLDDLATRFDAHNVFLTGFSNGAGMTFRAAAALPRRFHAIAPVAGHCWIDEPAAPVPTLYLIGSDDPLIPLAGGEVLNPWKRRDVKPSVADTLGRWSRLMGGSPIGSEIIPGLGHHWPGGLGRLSERIGGKPSDAVDGTHRIWQFFRETIQ